jgi:hypothetical protein
MKKKGIIQTDIRDLRINLTRYIDKYPGKKIYISKYNRIIGELKFYSDEEKNQARISIAREIIKNSNAGLDLL